MIRVRNRHLLLAGGRPSGTVYAVDRFLQDQCGVRWLTLCAREPWRNLNDNHGAARQQKNAVGIHPRGTSRFTLLLRHVVGSLARHKTDKPFARATSGRNPSRAALRAATRSIAASLSVLRTERHSSPRLKAGVSWLNPDETAHLCRWAVSQSDKGEPRATQSRTILPRHAAG